MIGVLLTNLGTPDAPTATAVRRYLAEFLWDRRVIEIPRLLWWPILHGLVLRLRPRQSAKLYQKIWTSAGSPLLINSQNLTAALQKKLSAQFNIPVKVALGMRYGNPSIAQALTELKQENPQRVVVLPLYPQYSSATIGSTFDAVSAVLKTWRHIPEINFLKAYYDHPIYTDAIRQSINAHPHSFEHLLFSFHGLPQRCITLGDPYQQQCEQTAQKIAADLQLSQTNWSIAFQSRFGRAQWLQPYCDQTLRTLPKLGKKNIAVVCPGFSVDCLETLEEIAIRNKEIFLEAGGENYSYIPALNSSVEHVELLVRLVSDVLLV